MSFYKISLITICLFAFGISHAQHKEEQEMQDRIDAYRAQFITEQLALTPEEAQLFWPVYNQYRKDLKTIQDKRMDRFPEDPDMHRPDLDAMTDAEIYSMMRGEMSNQKEMLNLREKYFEKFDEVLPIRKVAKLYHAEIEFQRRLIRRLRNHQPPQPE